MPDARACEEVLCQYGASRLLCRGPRRVVSKPYVAFLGTSETFGKFVETPFVAQIEKATGVACVNLGAANSGLDAFVQDPDILKIAAGADLAVIQVMGAQNLSNRYYRVHPRRNDRFLQASPLLSAIYAEVDFTDFHFNKHLLGTLKSISSTRFRAVKTELQDLWLARMRLLLRTMAHKPLLLWLRYPADSDALLGADPLLVGRSMLNRLKPDIAGIIEIAVERTGEPGELDKMRFGQMQAPAASHMIGPDTHSAIASQLAGVLSEFL